MNSPSLLSVQSRVLTIAEIDEYHQPTSEDIPMNQPALVLLCACVLTAVCTTSGFVSRSRAFKRLRFASGYYGCASKVVILGSVMLFALLAVTVPSASAQSAKHPLDGLTAPEHWAVYET